MSKKENKKEAQPFTTRGEIYEWIQCVITALIICVLMFVFCVKLVNVNGNSMNPTLNNADKMIVSHLFYDPKPGDIVVFKKDEYDPDKALVKRIIATEGQVVNIDFEKGIVYVDGEPLTEDYTLEPTYNKLDFIGPQTVPEGCVFVLGDNRNGSRDSRYKLIGMVDSRLILGKVYCVIFPFADIGAVK